MALQRRAYFIGGFDPRSPRHYHRLMRRAAQARPDDGAETRVGPREDTHWPMDWASPDGRWHTRYTVLRWDDVVRAHWPSGLPRVLRQAARVYGRACADPAYLRRLWRDARAGLFMGFTPLALLAGSAAAGAALGLSAAVAGLPGWGTAGLGAAAAAWLAATSAKTGHSAWMLGLLDLSDGLAHGDDALTAHQAQWAAELVAAAEANDADELLLLAHSIGCNWAVATLACALRQAPWLGTRGPRLRLVTLGQTLPLSTLRTGADALRADVALLAATPQLRWLDVTAPADWAAFARLPPWFTAPAPVAAVEARSPRFHAVLTPAHYAALKRDRQALHMQYLHAPDAAGGCDIVALAAGPAPPET